MRAPRRIVALTVAAVAVLPVVAQAAHAATPAATPYPLSVKLAGLTTVYQMVEADGKLFVSSGPNGASVDVYSTSGQHLKSVVGAGASGLVVSPDGADVYAALANSNGILEIDASTLDSVTTMTVDSCPFSLAFASDRLFYSYGCDLGGSGVASVDPADPTTPVNALTSLLQGAPLVRGSGSTLVVSDTSDKLASYTAGTDGSLAPEASVTLPDRSAEDITISSDGQDVLVAPGAPYNVYSYSLSDMQQQLVYPATAYPDAVAADPTGSYVAGGLDSYDPQVYLYGATSGAVVWQRFTATTSPSTWQSGQSDDNVLSQTMTFSPDGSHLFGLVKRENTTGVFLFDSSVNPQHSSTSIKVPNVGAGRPHKATVHAPAGTVVTFVLTPYGRPPRVLGTAKANSSGVATKTFSSEYSGKLTAAVAGGANLLPSQRTVAFSSQSKTVAKFVGTHSMRHGVAVYKSFKQIGVVFKTTPAEYSRANHVAIQRKVGRHWVVVGRLTGYSNQYGARIFFERKPPAGEYRVSLSVPSDPYSRGSSAMSKPFSI